MVLYDITVTKTLRLCVAIATAPGPGGPVLQRVVCVVGGVADGRCGPHEAVPARAARSADDARIPGRILSD